MCCSSVYCVCPKSRNTIIVALTYYIPSLNVSSAVSKFASFEGDDIQLDSQSNSHPTEHPNLVSYSYSLPMYNTMQFLVVGRWYIKRRVEPKVVVFRVYNVTQFPALPALPVCRRSSHLYAAHFSAISLPPSKALPTTLRPVRRTN